ncbi:MAG TPA: hypothetical protein DCG12_11240, partial [Planctomycetaceae bacterium]|nr:hypothetical protein [Planctomycetaceae bacterium]
ACNLLDSLRDSSLYRSNQNSYLLYPDRRLPDFLSRNNISPHAVSGSPLLQDLLAQKNRQIICRDVRGGLHFNGQFRNSTDLRAELQRLPEQFRHAVEQEEDTLVKLFDELFDHRRFTGRSGTFFAYEGLGSIYWHMVSKLALAVVENFFRAVDEDETPETIERLRDHFQAVRAGIGAEKTPEEYGAFPSDPYSHTPENSGVKQPGMTGQVKEDLLSRFAEIGAHVNDGTLRFRFELFDTDELLTEARDFTYYNVAGE